MAGKSEAEKNRQMVVPEDGPSADNPAIIPEEGLATGDSSADIPYPGEEVVVIAEGERYPKKGSTKDDVGDSLKR